MAETQRDVTVRLNGMWEMLAACEQTRDPEQLHRVRNAIARMLANRITMSIHDHGITPVSELIDEVDWRGGL